jgi:hypothetical protein
MQSETGPALCSETSTRISDVAMREGRRGSALTVSDPRALAQFECAVDAFLGHRADRAALLAEPLQSAPGFLLRITSKDSPDSGNQRRSQPALIRRQGRCLCDARIWCGARASLSPAKSQGASGQPKSG